MGLRYLDGLSWADITREERYFCQHLYGLINKAGADSFVKHLNESLGLSLQVDANWEAAYEVCFYRDLWHHQNRSGRPFSPKRTFDLCMFSDSAIVIIEAKAHQQFDSDQLLSFAQDRAEVRRQTGVEDVILIGLVSSRYSVPEHVRTHFDGRILTWAALSHLYSSDPILTRADNIYMIDSAGSWGCNNTGGYMTGSALIEAHCNGEEFVVGRVGGLAGKLLKLDLESGGWRGQKYETNLEMTEPPNRNWFRLSEFAQLVERQNKK